MQFDAFTYINGACAAVYTVVCLLCGLQLCGQVFFHKWKSNLLLSVVLGIILLMMATAGVCYMVAAIVPSLSWLLVVGAAIDLVMFTGQASVAYILYANNRPSAQRLLLLAWPYVAIVGMYFVVPDAWQDHLLDIAMLILMAQYIYFAHKIHHREQLLEDLYSNPDSHSLKWIWTVIAINAGWWIIRYVFGRVTCLNDLMYIAAYLYMTGYVLFVFTKIINYGEPVSPETQQAIENANNENNENNAKPHNENNAKPNNENNGKSRLVANLKNLMEHDRMYLNSDLTIENVAHRLNVTPQYLSVIINNDLNANFSQWVNGYRIEKAKELLQTTNDKVEYIAMLCGFNSVQVFNRTFIKHTGKTPSAWRK